MLGLPVNGPVAFEADAERCGPLALLNLAFGPPGVLTDLRDTPGNLQGFLDQKIDINPGFPGVLLDYCPELGIIDRALQRVPRG